ncbi:hypothetical protein NCCP2050_25870 [Planococcus sp. NCCP-2050]|nr:hypothetical protein NCCP2050_25870 [Planococcus sp. NCCP-2050]
MKEMSSIISIINVVLAILAITFGGIWVHLFWLTLIFWTVSLTILNKDSKSKVVTWICLSIISLILWVVLT